MLDYFASRENFLDVGEQYSGHLGQNIKEWSKFVQFYSDVNNTRKSKDDDYNREQFIGEELDWKMLADNLTLFQSQMGDLKDMQGFDPNSSLAMDQSIHISGDPDEKDKPFNNFISEQPFNPDISMVQRRNSERSNAERSNTVPNREPGTILDDVKPHPGSSLAPAENDSNQQQEQAPTEESKNEEENKI